jgi:hypothetical protein
LLYPSTKNTVIARNSSQTTQKASQKIGG